MPAAAAELNDGSSAAGSATLPRVVLDTNVCLDLFVFRDPRWDTLLQALRDKSIQAVTRDDCRNEWMAVLNYPHLPLTEADKPDICAAFDQLITCLPVAGVNSFGLPLCSDKDDQKFLELALQSGADVLITKDKALLKLARKTLNKGMFRIIPPQAWNAELHVPRALS